MSSSASITPTQEVRKTRIRNVNRPADPVLAKLHYMASRVSERLTWKDTLHSRARLIGEQVIKMNDLSEQKFEESVRLAGEGLFRRDDRTVSDSENVLLAAACVQAERLLGMRPHREQIIASAGLLDGRMMEMATGEGKTLSLALASVPIAARKRVHHVLTSNDYLAKRDESEMKALFEAFGLTSGRVLSSTSPSERSFVYQSDIVYSTPRELVADFLRDRLVYGALADGERRLIRCLFADAFIKIQGAVLRGIDSIFLDEADHVLIDEAVTPLIISGPSNEGMLGELVTEVSTYASELQTRRDFRISPDGGKVFLTPSGKRRMASDWNPRHPVLQPAVRRVEWVEKALVAQHVLIRDHQYIIRDGKVQIIDQSLGRILPDRSWSQGLHQLVEAKEKLHLTPPTKTLASISFQRFFRGIPRLAGISGTLVENSQELHRLFAKRVIKVPLHLPCKRQCPRPRYFEDAESKYCAAVRRVKSLQVVGQPVLVGTRSLRVSELFSAKLKEAGIPHAILNAAQNAREASIIQCAGQKGRVTIATNMAGRGVDISLEPGFPESRGLCVLQIEGNPSRRIDRQLHGRCARQGQPGRVEVFRSMDETGLVVGPGESGKPTSVSQLYPIFKYILRLDGLLFSSAQYLAVRRAYRSRLLVLERDDWLDRSLL